jgi:hypothetical protein
MGVGVIGGCRHAALGHVPVADAEVLAPGGRDLVVGAESQGTARPAVLGGLFNDTRRASLCAGGLTPPLRQMRLPARHASLTGSGDPTGRLIPYQWQGRQRVRSGFAP